MDTNIFVRFLVNDDPVKWRDCERIFKKISLGEIIPYSSELVFLEIYYVLTSFYKRQKSEVSKDLLKFLKLRNLVLIKKYDLGRAFRMRNRLGIKLADCLISSQIPKNVLLCSYDRDFKKVKGIKLVLPQDIV